MMSGDAQVVEEDSHSKMHIVSRRTNSGAGSAEDRRQSNGTKGSSIRFEDEGAPVEHLNPTSSSEIVVGGCKSLNS